MSPKFPNEPLSLQLQSARNVSCLTVEATAAAAFHARRSAFHVTKQSDHGDGRIIEMRDGELPVRVTPRAYRSDAFFIRVERTH
jgi:hypothetical protein